MSKSEPTRPSTLATIDLVQSAYMCILGRMPETDAILQFYASLTNTEVLNALLNSEEFRLKSGRNPLYHYNSMIDCEAIIHSHARRDLLPESDICINFLGTRILPKFLPNILTPMTGFIDRVPIPANWHADIAEWAAALRSVELSTEKFSMLELGCGWGCWMVNTGVAARNAGREVHLSGVEADEGHLAFAYEACRLNGFSEASFDLRRGIASARQGYALFPRQNTPGENWGNEPIFNLSTEEAESLCSTGRYERLPNVTLSELYDDGFLDLVHIDIQGGEADFVEASLDELTAKVSYLVIGTHSRELEGRLFNLLHSRNWVLEVERPAILNLTQDEPFTLIDGVQGWRNPSRF